MQGIENYWHNGFARVYGLGSRFQPKYLSQAGQTAYYPPTIEGTPAPAIVSKLQSPKPQKQPLDLKLGGEGERLQSPILSSEVPGLKVEI